MIKEPGYPVVLDTFFRCEQPSLEQADENTAQDSIKRMDMIILENINKALWKNDVLRATDLAEIEIHVNDAVVFLSGHIISSTNRHRIEKALQTVPGIQLIRSNLVMDDELMLEVAGSLAQLEHIHNCKFFTGVSHGVVVLSGVVSSLEVSQAAVRCAAGNPKVRGVINKIQVDGFNAESQDNRFLQPLIGTQMYFLDGIFGIVRKVVINPDDRRVSAMIIQGSFNHLHQDLGSIDLVSEHPDEQMLVIPMSVMGYLTSSSGSLTIASTDVALDQKFDPSLFVGPPANWVPPYPYCQQEVLFRIENSRADLDSATNSTRMTPAPQKADQKISAEILANDSLGG